MVYAILYSLALCRALHTTHIRTHLQSLSHIHTHTHYLCFNCFVVRRKSVRFFPPFSVFVISYFYFYFSFKIAAACCCYFADASSGGNNPILLPFFLFPACWLFMFYSLFSVYCACSISITAVVFRLAVRIDFLLLLELGRAKRATKIERLEV